MTATKTAPAESSAASRKEAPGVTKRSSSYFIDPKTIVRREGWNPRFVFEEIEELAESLTVNGMLNPIRVKRILAGDPRLDAGMMFELIDGDRRFSALEALFKEHGSLDKFPLLQDGVPAIIVDKGQEDKTSFIQMFVANTGKEFKPLEEAAAYKRMKDPVDAGGYAMTIKEICKAVGRREMHVTEILALAIAEPELKAAVAKGEVGKTQAKRIAKHARGDAATQKKLTETAKKANKGDKTAKADLEKGLDAARRGKAAKHGKTLKMRALSDDALAALGQGVHKELLKRMKEAGKPEDFNLREWVEKDDQLALAATFGALEALKASAGVKIDLSF